MIDLADITLLSTVRADEEVAELDGRARRRGRSDVGEGIHCETKVCRGFSVCWKASRMSWQWIAAHAVKSQLNVRDGAGRGHGETALEKLQPKPFRAERRRTESREGDRRAWTYP